MILQVGEARTQKTLTSKHGRLWKGIFYPNTLSLLSDKGSKITTAITAPDQGPPARYFQEVGGTSVPYSLNSSSEETID